MDWNDALQKIGITLKDGTIEYIEQYCREEVSKAKAIQQENDIISAIMGFIDLKASDMDILKLLQKHFDVESISEGKSYIFDARSYYQCDKLKEHLNLSGIAWTRYKKDNAVLDKLKANPKLLEMPPDKLKAYLEKK